MEGTMKMGASCLQAGISDRATQPNTMAVS
jgi:hypothetical protein